MVLLVTEAIVELEKEGLRDCPGVSNSKEIGHQGLVGCVWSVGVVEEAILMMVIYVAGTAHEGTLGRVEVMIDAEVELVFSVICAACIAVVIVDAGSIRRWEKLEQLR